MNECEKYREMISAMLDGELDHADNERLIKHMSSCAECREMYELLSAVSGSDVWRLPDTPKDLHAHIMSGVKSAADEDKRRIRMRHSRYWLAAAACLVVVVAVILGIPRISGGGDSGNRAPSSAILNGSADASSAAPADTAGGASDTSDVETAGQSSPSSEDRSENGKAEAPTPAPGGAGSVSGGGAGGESEGANDTSEPSPVPTEDEPEDEPEPTEEPLPDMDIAESVVTVESAGGSASETLSREDTLIWLRAVIEGPTGGINVAKIEIHRDEGTDYEVYFYHDGSQLMGSLSDDLSGSVEINRLADFAVFEEMVNEITNTEDAEGTENTEQ